MLDQRACERRALRVLASAGAIALIETLAITTWQRNADYRSEVALWQATVRDSPQKARAWLNLGYAYRLANDTAGAAQAYCQVLALEPENAQAAINLDLLAPSGATPPNCRDVDTNAN